MSKFSLLFLAMCATLATGMKGGMELTKKFDYFVYFLTGDSNEAPLSFNATTKMPNTKWLYCMGILYDDLTVLTAEPCRVEPDGVHWAAGHGTEIGQIHLVKSVIRGRHPLDFRLVEVKNSSVEKWGPLGDTDPLLMERVTQVQLWKVAEKKTKGIVTTVSKPIKIGAMMMLNLDECLDKYLLLVGKFPNSTAVLPASLPRSVFCAVQADKAFDPNPQPNSRFRREDSTVAADVTAPAAPAVVTPPVGPTAEERPLGLSPVNTGPVVPGTACPDSLGSPFIIAGGKVLGILVAADCHTVNVSFFQSLADDLPPSQQFDHDPPRGTLFIPYATTRVRRWTPRGPMMKGETLRPVGYQAGAGLKPLGAASSFGPSLFLVSMGLTYALGPQR